MTCTPCPTCYNGCQAYIEKCPASIRALSANRAIASLRIRDCNMRRITSQKFEVPEYDESDAALLVVRSDVIASTDVNVSPFDDYLARSVPDSSKRNRMQFRWALDLRKRCEFELAFWLEDLKVTRQFTTVMRNATRLYRDFEAGEYTVLAELFPGVVKKIIDDARPASEDFNRLLAEIYELKRMRTAAPAAPRPPSVPDADDSDLLTVRKAASDGKSGQRFLDSALNLLNIQ